MRHASLLPGHAPAADPRKHPEHAEDLGTFGPEKKERRKES